MVWFAEQLRVTLFPLRPLAEVNSSWWQQHVGSMPDQRQLHPKTLQSLEVGSFGTGELVLAQEPLRIDWVYRVPPSRIIPASAAPAVLGEIEVALHHFQEIITSWFAASPCEIKRLAFAGVYVHPVADEDEGRRLLAELLPVLRIDPERDREIVFRINRRRTSSVEPDLLLNRLSTWSLRQSILLALAAESSGIAQAPVGTSLACQIDIDFNTDQARTTAIPATALAPILRELSRDSLTLAAEGIR